jgi:hypothetical protein
MIAELQTPHRRRTAQSPGAPPMREPASPPSMRLQAVREHRLVVDFRWEFASAAAAHLLRCHPLALRGKRLREAAAGPLCNPALIERYRHVLDGSQDIVVHHVVPEGDGVAVTLTNVSADRRARTLGLQSTAASAGGHRSAP